MTLQGKMCNGMVESISNAFWSHTSATKRSCLLLLLLTAVSTGQGSGKRQNLWLDTQKKTQSIMEDVLIILFSTEETIPNLILSQHRPNGCCQGVLTCTGCFAYSTAQGRLDRLPLIYSFQHMPVYHQ